MLKHGKTYEEVYNSFRWKVPTYYNIAVDCCDKWAGQRYRLALVYENEKGAVEKFTFWDLKELSNRLANALRNFGIQPGDRVGILLPQSLETALTHLAIYKLGAIAIPIFTLFGPEALEYRLGNSGAKAVVTDPANMDKVLEIRNRLPNFQHLFVTGGPGPEGTTDFWKALEKGASCFKPAVLNTMIGSVYERKREIAVYTSVGLAPSHVSFLFIAEALAFAVLSVVFGYLVAQTTAKIFAGTALWTGITVNYSSLAGVAAMLLVIAVVLVSVIYPSRVAGEIAIPDVNRSWTLPPARANTIEVSLPFLMTYREHLSVGGYLVQFFDGHKDVSHGRFSTSDLVLEFSCETAPHLSAANADCPEQACELPDCLHLTSHVWLAPFDFGIMQRAEFKFRPSADQPGFLEIHVHLIRESGESNVWHRINKGFLHDIRRQLLIWRSLDDDAKRTCEERLDEYRQHAAAPATDRGPA